MRNLNQLFVLCTASQTIGGDFAEYMNFRQLVSLDSRTGITILAMDGLHKIPKNSCYSNTFYVTFIASYVVIYLFI